MRVKEKCGDAELPVKVDPTSLPAGTVFEGTRGTNGDLSIFLVINWEIQGSGQYRYFVDLVKGVGHAQTTFFHNVRVLPNATLVKEG